MISFLNLLIEIAESFSTSMLIFFLVLPQITLLSVLQDLTITSLIGNNTVILAQVTTLRLYYSRTLRWLGY